MRRRTTTLVLSTCLAACGESGVELTVEYGPGQTVVAVSTVDGRAIASLHPYRAGEPLRVDADPDRPIYTWILQEGDYVRPSGADVPSVELDALAVRTDGPAPGGCGRCLAPSTKFPQVMNPGESCLVPSWNRGAIWHPDGDAFRCAGAPGSRVCAEGNGDDGIELERVRRSLWLEWPGDCACRPPQAPANLSQMTVEAVTPDDAPWPLNTFSAREDGVIAGFSRNGAAVWDPATGRTEFTRFDDLDTTVRHSTALPNGDFLVSAGRFNTSTFDEHQYYRVSIVDGRAQAPVPLDDGGRAIAERLMVLDDAGDWPLYLIGGERGLGSVEPGMYACSTNPFTCQRVDVEQCIDLRRFSRIYGLSIFPDGTGVAIAHQGLYYKAPNAPPLINPHPSDAWSCFQFEDPVPRADEEGSVEIVELSAMTRQGDRAYVCAIAKSTERCTSDFSVIMTATVAAAPGELPDPDWRVTWSSSPGRRCREFLDSGQSGVVRMQLSGATAVDLDADGYEIDSQPLSDLYGSFPSMDVLSPLADGTLLGRGRENQVYANTGTTSFTKIYGPEETDGATYRAIGVDHRGDFIVFGHPRGVTRVRSTDATATVIEAPELSGVRVDAAVVDEALSSADRTVFLIGGSKDGDAYLARVDVGDTVSVGQPLALPSTFAENLDIVDVAAIHPGRFVAVTHGTKILQIDGDTVTEIELDVDDLTTPDVETFPRPQPDACSGNVPRVDHWRRVVGGHGVAWAIGRDGYVVRVAGGVAERFKLDKRPTLYGATLGCPDDLTLTGYGTASELEEMYGIMVFYRNVATPLPPDAETVALDARGLDFERFAVDELFSLSISEVTYQRPIDLLPDTTTDREAAPRAVVLANGFVYRLGATERIRYVRTPFNPLRAVQAPDGSVLFVGGESRMAIGRP
ncbi:MAG: hypothetical protein RIT81_11645 [Deltaproteobacteria bacterium]